MQAAELFGIPTFVIDQTGGIEPYIRVKLKAGGKIEIAGAGESGIGHIRPGTNKDGEDGAVRLHSDPGKQLVVLAGNVTDISTLFPVAAGKYDDAGTGTPVYKALEANIDGDGTIIAAILDPVVSTTAATVTITDAGGFTAATEVESALAEIYQDLISAQHVIDAPISSIMLEDGTPLGKWSAGATPGFKQISAKELVVAWDGNASPGPVAVTLPFVDPRIDDSADVVVHILARMNGVTDTPVVVFEAYFNAGDTDAAGTDPEVTGGVTLTEYTMTIASADVPAAPGSLTLIMTPTAGEMGTDELYIYAAWLEVTSKVRTS